MNSVELEISLKSADECEVRDDFLLDSALGLGRSCGLKCLCASCGHCDVSHSCSCELLSEKECEIHAEDEPAVVVSCNAYKRSVNDRRTKASEL
jgi:hypothetical protein